MSKPSRPEPTSDTAGTPHDAAYYERLVIGKAARPRRRPALIALAVVLLAGGSHAAVRLAHRSDDLRLAVLHSDTPQVNRLLAWGADANMPAAITIPNAISDSSARKSGKTLLMVAVTTGKPAIVDALLAHEADPNIQASNGQTALLMASALRNPAIVHSLLAHGADWRQRDAKGRAALLVAAREGQAANVQALLEHGAAIEDRDNAQQSALCLASVMRHEEVVRLLLDRGASLDSLTQARLAQDEWRTAHTGPNYFSQMPGREWTPLAWAASAGSPALIAAVWDTRLTPQERDQQQYQALNLATESGSVDAVRALLDRHVPVEAAAPPDAKRGSVYWCMPLYWAAQYRNLPLCQLLIARGAHVNAAFSSGLSTPLMAAASDFNPFIVQLLLEHGANVNAVDYEGKTALMHCGSSQNIAELLIAQGANVNARDFKGYTALQYDVNASVMRVLLEHGADAHGPGINRPLLAYGVTPDVAELLIAHGADVDARDSQGKTPLISTWDPALVPVLVAHGADVNARDNQGLTPLHAAAQHNMVAGIKLLLEHGANRNAPDVNGVTPIMAAQRSGYKPEVDAFTQVPAR